MIKEECDIILNYIDWENGYRTNYQAKRKWLLVKDEIEFLKRQHYLLIEHFEKMHQLRKLEDVSKIQEKYWHSLYLGYIVEMQRDIEQRIKQLESKNE